MQTIFDFSVGLNFIYELDNGIQLSKFTWLKIKSIEWIFHLHMKLYIYAHFLGFVFLLLLFIWSVSYVFYSCTWVAPNNFFSICIFSEWRNVQIYKRTYRPSWLFACNVQYAYNEMQLNRQLSIQVHLQNWPKSFESLYSVFYLCIWANIMMIYDGLSSTVQSTTKFIDNIIMFIDNFLLGWLFIFIRIHFRHV